MHLICVSHSMVVFLLGRMPDQGVKEVQFLLTNNLSNDIVGLEIINKVFNFIDISFFSKEKRYMIYDRCFN